MYRNEGREWEGKANIQSSRGGGGLHIIPPFPAPPSLRSHISRAHKNLRRVEHKCIRYMLPVFHLSGGLELGNVILEREK